MVWSIQVLRFVAASMVVYTHAVNTAMQVNGSIGFIPVELGMIGWCGVDIFFVISGFVIAKIGFGKTPAEFIWGAM